MRVLDVLFFGTYDERTHPRVQVLREGLEADGHRVRTCNVPLELDTAARVAIAAKPWRAPMLLARLLAAWVRLIWRARRLDQPHVVVVGYLGQLDIRLARRLFRCPIVLDLMVTLADTARDRQLGGDLLHRVLNRIDGGAIERADLVLVDTQENRTLVPSARAAHVIVTPVGAPLVWERPPPRGQATSLKPLRVVFFGLFTPLQGAPVIGEAIALLADEASLEFTMIGAGQDLEATRTRSAPNPRVRWLPWVEPDELVDVVASHHICLGIFGTGDKARRVVPNKVYQGAAAGCAVVTSDTAAQRRALGEAARLVPAGNPTMLAEELRALVSAPDELDRLRRAAHDLATTRFSPAAVTRELNDRLRELAR